MKQLIIISAAILSCVLAAGLTSCTGKGKNMNNNSSEPTCGGTTDNTDYNASKHIESDDLIYFRDYFYFESDIDESLSGFYDYELKKDDNGSFILSEDSKYKVSSEITEDEVALIQALIRAQNLESLNGLDKITRGLPGEFCESVTICRYSSDESIYIRCNSFPQSPDSYDMIELFRTIFLSHGVEEVRIPREIRNVTRFDLNFADNGVLYDYYRFTGENQSEYLCRTLYDIEKSEDISEDYVSVPEDYYSVITSLVEQTNFRKYANGAMPSSGEYSDYAQMCINFENGRQYIAFYDKGEIPDGFVNDAHIITEYMDSLFKN